MQIKTEWGDFSTPVNASITQLHLRLGNTVGRMVVRARGSRHYVSSLLYTVWEVLLHM